MLVPLLADAGIGIGMLLALGFALTAVFIIIGLVLDFTWRRQRRQVTQQTCVVCEITRSKEGHHV